MRCIDLQKKQRAKDMRTCGLQITELSTHLQGQLVAVHPAYDVMLMVSHRSRHGKPKSARPGQFSN
jgi:hypothetical protein